MVLVNMSTYEMWSIVFSGIAIVISIIALINTTIKSSNANLIAEKANNTSMAEIEMHLYDAISSSSRNVQDITLRIAPVICKDKKDIGEYDKDMALIYKSTLDAAIEDNINAYEAACQKYIDEKIDKERFKKTYKTDIRNLVQHKDYSDRYFNRNKTVYHGILKVYDEWENLEQ